MKHKRNETTPFRSFRLPTREADQHLVEAAKADGITVSEWIRRAIANALGSTDKQ